MTLADVLPIAMRLTPSEELRLIRILVDELDSSPKGAIVMEAGATYQIDTPLDQYGAAHDLLAAFPDVHMPGPEAATAP